MATSFPTALDQFTNPSPGQPMNNPSHSEQHANVNDAIESLQVKVGIDGSGNSSSIDHLLTNPASVDPGHLHSISAINGLLDALDALDAKPGMEIGAAIDGEPTEGSVLFVGGGGALAQDNAALFWDAANSRLGVGTASPSAALQVNGAVSGIAAIFRANATTPGNLTEWQGSDGAVRAKVASNGALTISAPTGGGSPHLTLHDPAYGGTGITITNYYNTSLGISPNNIVLTVVNTANGCKYYSDYQGHTFTKSNGNIGVGITPDGKFGINPSGVWGVSALPATLYVKPLSASDIGMVIRGAASQSGNIQEWQNSAGTALSSISAAGKFLTSTDIEVTGSANGVILESPDATRWRITVADDGTISATAA